MKASGLINIGILPLLLEAMTPAYAQREPREQEPRRPSQEQEGRPEKQRPQPVPTRESPRQRPERQPQEPRAERSQPPSRPMAQETPRRPVDLIPERRPRASAPARPDDQRRSPAPPGRGGYESQHRGAWGDRRARDWQVEHRSWQQRGGYTGYRIPDDRYRSYFGSRHGFRMFSFPLVVVGGYPRFQFGGLWFSVLDPWPEYWAEDWYGSDYLYIEYFGGGYYLRNRAHPRDRMALTVFIN